MRPVLQLGCALLMATVVTACGQNPDTADAPDVPRIDKLAGVDLNGNLSLVGTEPFWAINLTQGQITLEGPDKAPTNWPRTGFYTDDAREVAVNAELVSEELTLVLTATPCSDGMSDRKYPLTAEATVGDEVLRGCAISTAELEQFRP
ncbi:MAG: hypothetical protein QM645_12170 [Asticcacaulis sp.]